MATRDVDLRICFRIQSYIVPTEAVYPPDGKAMIAYVDQFCSAHPLDTIASAALSLLGELRERQGLPRGSAYLRLPPN